MPNTNKKGTIVLKYRNGSDDYLVVKLINTLRVEINDALDKKAVQGLIDAGYTVQIT